MNDTARLDALTQKVSELEHKVEFLMRHLQAQSNAAPVPPAETEVTKWLRAGNKIAAIKAYRETTGVGLAEAKTAVDALEKQLGGR